MWIKDYTDIIFESMGYKTEEINDKDIQFLIKELLQYLLPDLSVDFTKAVFPDRFDNLEARLSFKFRKTDKKFWIDISKNTSSRNYIGSLTILTSKTNSELLITVIAVRSQFEGLSRKNYKLNITLTQDQLKHPIPTKKIFDSIPELKDIKEMFKELFNKIKELGGKI